MPNRKEGLLSEKGILVVHPTGNANLRAALSGFSRNGVLHSFHTAISCKTGSWADRLSGLPGLGELNRRRFDHTLDAVTVTYPFYELARLAAMRLGWKRLVTHETGRFSVDALYRHIDAEVARLISTGKVHPEAVYAYEDGAAFAFQAALKKDIPRIYDLPIGYWRAARRLMEVETAKRPEWAATMAGFRDSETKTARKDDELQMASCIYVASSFTAETLKDFPGNLQNVQIVSYGFPQVEKMKDTSIPANRPLRLLFVGGLSQRKGIADVFDAVKPLGKAVELTVIGRAPDVRINALEDGLSKCRWIPSLPHKEVLKEMRNADVLLFPSLFEGFGLVITESMSQGTPVITTSRTAGPDLICDGTDGWIVKAGAPGELQLKIQELLDNRDSILKAGEEARKKAAARPWNCYGDELVSSVLNNIKLHENRAPGIK